MTEPDRPEGPDLPLWEVVRTYHPVARGFGEVFSAVGLTPAQFGVLAVLRDEDPAGPGPTQAELARQVLVRPQSVGELLTGLVERGLVVRDGPGGRGRPAPLRLTDDGRGLVERAYPAVVAFNAPASLGLTAEESLTLTRLLRRVRAALDEPPPR